MSKFEGLLLVSDFDGTLVNSSHQVSKENIKAINDFARNGGLFCGATGRTQFNVRPYLKGLPINCPWILYNGACLYDFNENKVKALIPVRKDPLKDILKKVMTLIPDICIHLYTEDRLYLINPSGIKDMTLIKEGQEFVFRELDAITEPWIKAIFHAENQVLQEVFGFIKALDQAQHYHVFFSIGTYLEVTQGQVSKGFALDLLKAEFKGRIRKVIAIGDYLNDLEMLQRADIKAAPANAHPEIKRYAKMITAHHDHHALADLIARLN